MSDHVKKVLLVGTGLMALEYIKVLKALKVESIVVGNRVTSVEIFKDKTGQNVLSGGVENYVNNYNDIPDYAIVAVNVTNLYRVTSNLIKAKISNILVEKPGGFSISEMEKLIKLARENQSRVYIAYNRRFYTSVEVAKKFIAEDGGLLSFNFEFTEWYHVIEKTEHPDDIKQKWFLMNSSHVVDLAFYLAGIPKEMSVYKSGGLKWHNVGSIYNGCGVTENDIPFTYQANWEAPGRWGVELLTAKHRLYLRPLEKLQIQKKGSVEIQDYDLDDKIDTAYKAGLYNEVKAFLYEVGIEKLCTLEEQRKHMDIYSEISGEEY